ncbi:prealbumin-like fold domain-containing protein [Listeria rocourtiae]|uniref:prealbumin-like fold domain-containing protein n=1 Tax=Listeria rocourtiae TaxID=647910 RepID=UPI003D2F58E1
MKTILALICVSAIILQLFVPQISYAIPDESGKKLTTTFEFILVSGVNENQVNQSVTKALKTNGEGGYYFDRLAPEKYEIKEVQAPAGYILNKKAQSFEIIAEFMKNLGAIKLADFVNYKGSYNGKNGILPETGDSDSMDLLIIGIILLGVGMFLFKPKKRDE